MNEMLKAGLRYLQTYPNQKKLSLFMPDYRLIRLVKFANRFMPAFACFAILWQYFFNDASQSVLINAIITALFALSIPPLPLHFLDWYETLRQKLLSEQVKIDVQAVPSYQDFANLLALAEKTWGNKYFDEL